jgi:hypothetical protein
LISSAKLIVKTSKPAAFFTTIPIESACMSEIGYAWSAISADKFGKFGQ